LLLLVGEPLQIAQLTGSGAAEDVAGPGLSLLLGTALLLHSMEQLLGTHHLLGHLGRAPVVHCPLLELLPLLLLPAFGLQLLLLELCCTFEALVLESDPLLASGRGVGGVVREGRERCMRGCTWL